MTLADFIGKPKNTSDVQAWYFRQTGGNQYRLRLGYLLARELDRRHQKNLFFGCLKPEDIDIVSSSPIKLAFSCSRYDYDSLPPEYADPLVASGNGLLSADSETYSFAVILFQMLAQYLPFEGSEYSSCGAEERAAGLKVGLFDYIGDYSGLNTVDDFEFETHLHLTGELQALFTRMFVDGKLDAGRRPSLRDFMGACSRAVRLLLLCDHGKYNAEYYGENSFACPFCKMVNAPLAELIALRQVSSDRGLLMGDQPVETDWETVGKMVMPGTGCKVSRSLFDSEVSYETDSLCLEIGIHKSSVQVTNRLKSLSVVAWAGKQKKQEILPGKMCEFPAQESRLCVAFKTNLLMNQGGEELMEPVDPVYGNIRVSYCLLVRRNVKP